MSVSESRQEFEAAIAWATRVVDTPPPPLAQEILDTAIWQATLGLVLSALVMTVVIAAVLPIVRAIRSPRPSVWCDRTGQASDPAAASFVVAIMAWIAAGAGGAVSAAQLINATMSPRLFVLDYLKELL